MQVALALPSAAVALPALLTPPATMAAEPAPALVPLASLILFGRDEAGRPHASVFKDDMRPAVERAADLMDLYCFPADTEALHNLAAMLPTGRLFPASGKAFVPFVKAVLYDRLLAATGTREAPPPVKAAGKAAEARGGAGGEPSGGPGGSGAGDPPATRVGAKAPAEHSQVGIGSIVLAQGDAGDEGFYPAKIVLTKSPDSFVLEWSNYDLPQFVRPRRSLALLHPEAVEAVE